MIAQFERFEIEMTMGQAQSASHQGQCDEDVRELLKCKAIRDQLEKIPFSKLVKELHEYGAWEADELEVVEDTYARVVWLAAGIIVDEQFADEEREG